MLKTLLDLPGDSFEKRWSHVEKRVRHHCEAAGAPYPKQTLDLVRPWFATVGDWFDTAATEAPEILGRRPPEIPGDEDPVLVLLREFDDLLSRFAHHSEGRSGLENRPGLPGRYQYLVGTIGFPNGTLVQVIQGEDYPVSLRREAIVAVAELMGLSGASLYRQRWEKVEPVLRERAKREDKTPETVLGESLEEAVWVSFNHFVRDAEQGSEATIHITSLMMQNLIPGTVAPDIRPRVNNWIIEDMLGPEWRDRNIDPDTEAKLQEHARTMLSHSPDPERRTLSNLVARDLLDHETLTERQRQVLRLHYLRELAPSEIADELGLTPSTIRSHLSNAHEKLREQLVP